MTLLCKNLKTAGRPWWILSSHSDSYEESYLPGIALCSLVKVNGRFGSTYCLYRRDRRVSQPWRSQQAEQPACAETGLCRLGGDFKNQSGATGYSSLASYWFALFPRKSPRERKRQKESISI
jgi:hypothetical protein